MVRVGDVPELTNEWFGTVIDSTQPIVVERSVYSNAGDASGRRLERHGDASAPDTFRAYVGGRHQRDRE